MYYKIIFYIFFLLIFINFSISRRQKRSGKVNKRDYNRYGEGSGSFNQRPGKQHVVKGDKERKKALYICDSFFESPFEFHVIFNFI